ncbi:MAG TPA: hypothetical protein VFX59_26305 [Polyangiales bacterium]|nr:hypothetical protein [Polyangiales bacterium]
MPAARLGRVASAFLRAASLMLSACPTMELAPLNPCTISSASIRVDTGGVSDVDLLFVIDNSASMASEQEKLAAQLPQLVNVLVSGDRYYGRTPPDSITDKERFFTPVRSLQLGVVSSSMGGAQDDSLGKTPALLDCVGLGDDGVLLRSVDVAVDGVVNTANDRFPDYEVGDTVLEPLAGCDELDAQPSYQNYAADGDTTAEELVQSFACVSRLGVRGCPFEQQLEAMWKAVAPSDGRDPALHTFLDGTRGHGDPDGVNEGFVRPDAILAVIEISDEEDCSITPDGTGLFANNDEATRLYTSKVNLRCGLFADSEGLLWPAERYVRGLRSLKPDNPDRIVFGAIVGIPLDTVNQDLDAILARADMQFEEDVAEGKNNPKTSCISSQGDKAYPPRRFLEVAKAFGEDAVVHSICDDSFAPALDRLIERIASKLSGNCLPQPLVRDADGEVRCDVFERLPPGEQACDPKRGHDDKPRTMNGASAGGAVCHMQQVPVIAGVRATDGIGWYYDDFSDELADDCKNSPQRISFTFGTLPGGGEAFIECFRPVPRIERNARGMDAVNLGCEATPSLCGERSDDAYTLFCSPDNSCQIECEKNPDCPPGWVCGPKQASGDGPKYCQIPTCPADEQARTQEP